MRLFEEATDFEALEQILRETLDESPMRVCAHALMPNHWHLLVWPASDGELAAFMERLTVTHVRRWQQYRGHAGLGHVYQGRYKSFPVDTDEHFWVVGRGQCIARIWSRERKIGGGPVCGDGATERTRSSRYWQLGPSKCHRIGSTESIRPMTGGNWKHFGGAYNEGVLTAGQSGRRISRSGLDWSRLIVRPGGRGRRGTIRASLGKFRLVV